MTKTWFDGEKIVTQEIPEEKIYEIRTVDDELTEEALEKMIMQVAGHIDALGEKTSLIPKWVMYRPAELEALGYTHEDIVKLIEKEHALRNP
jgi:hypothetical protein